MTGMLAKALDQCVRLNPNDADIKTLKNHLQAANVNKTGGMCGTEKT